MVAVERLGPHRLGKVRFGLADCPGSLQLVEVAAEDVAAGNSIHTDGARMLRRLGERGHTHQYRNGYDAEDPTDVLPGVHLVVSLLTRWIAGTLHHNISDMHLPYALDENSFRFHRRARLAVLPTAEAGLRTLIPTRYRSSSTAAERPLTSSRNAEHVLVTAADRSRPFSTRTPYGTPPRRTRTTGRRARDQPAGELPVHTGPGGWRGRRHRGAQQGRRLAQDRDTEGAPGAEGLPGQPMCG